MDFEVKVDDKALLKALDKLPRSMGTKAIRFAGRDGAAVVKKGAEENIQQVAIEDTTGTLLKSLAVYSLKKLKGMFRFSVQVKRGAMNKKVGKPPVRVGLYASVLEYGKQNQPPRSWLRKAAKEKTSEVLNAVWDSIRSRLGAAIEDAKK